VIPILDIISNRASASVPPTVGRSAQNGSAHQAGGFASTLAVAQGLSPKSERAASAVESRRAASNAVPNLDPRAQVSGNAPCNKKLDSLPAKLSTASVMNIAAAELSAASMMQIPLSLPPSSPAASLAQLDLLLPKVLDSALLSTEAVSNQAPSNQAVTGTVKVPDVRSGITPLQAQRMTRFDQSLPSSVTGVLTPTANQEATQLSATGAARVPGPDLSGAANVLQDQSTASGTKAGEPMQPQILSSVTTQFARASTSPNSATANQPNADQNGGGYGEPVLLAGRVQPAGGILSTEPPASVLPDPASSFQEVASLDAGPELRSAAEPGSGRAAESAVRNSSTLASAPGSEAPATTADLQSGADSSANILAGASSPASLPAAGVENPLSVIDPPVAASVLVSASRLAAGRSAVRFVAPGVGDVIATSNVREAGSAAVSSSSDSPSGIEAGAGAPLASQTPFSVFFSGPGPGADSAASTLPKMIFPVTTGAGRVSHATVHDEMNAGAQPRGLPQTSATHSAAAQNSKDSATVPSAGSGSGNGIVQAGQPVRRDTDLSTANGQVAATPAGLGPTSLSATSSAAALPLAGSETPVADLLPKTSVIPGPPGGAPNMVPATPEPPAGVPPGPVQIAQMMNRIDQSEMRIGMNTSAFGSVEVRAVVHANDVGLMVGSEKGDLRALLANDMPALANSLQEQNLRLHSVNFMQGFAFSNSSSGGGGDAPPRPFVPQGGAPHIGLSETAVEDSREALTGGEFFGGNNSFSILA
jgi:hypothetical protein